MVLHPPPRQTRSSYRTIERLFLEAFDECILPDGGPNDPPSGPPSSSPPSLSYHLYLYYTDEARVVAYTAILDQFNQLNGQIEQSRISSQDLINTQYDVYQVNVQEAADRYTEHVAAAKQSLMGAIGVADAGLMADIAEASTHFETEFALIGSTVNEAFDAAMSSLVSTMDAADALFETTAVAAWDEGDIAANDNAESVWYATFASAVNAYNTDFDSTTSMADQLVDGQIEILTTSITTAEVLWTQRIQSALDVFLQYEASEWSQYLSAEASAWAAYEIEVALILQQFADSYQQAVDSYEAGTVPIVAQFHAEESTFLNLYVASGGVMERDDAPPYVPAAAESPFLQVPNARKPNPNQGQAPIDWSKGVIVTKETKPWGANPADGPTGSELRINIGNDANGNPVFIRAFDAFEPYRADWQYNCHGYSFAGSAVFILDSISVRKIIDKFYRAIPQSNAQSGDIIVIYDALNGAMHSFVIVTPVFKTDGTLDRDRTIVSSKNGLDPLQQNVTFASIWDPYSNPNLFQNPGVGYVVYTRV